MNFKIRICLTAKSMIFNLDKGYNFLVCHLLPLVVNMWIYSSSFKKTPKFANINEFLGHEIDFLLQWIYLTGK